MEQDFNEFKDDIFEHKNYFETDFKGQKVKNTIKFQTWYDGAKKYVKKENNKRKQLFISETGYTDISILTIEYCDKCLAYTICSLTSDDYIKCNRCHEEFCIGCSRKRQKIDEYSGEETTCLKGYLKGLYLRIINRKSELVEANPLFYVMHIIFCLFFTPLFLGFISNFMGLIVHPNKKRKIGPDDIYDKQCFLFIYSLFRGLLMFPYIILFLPFMIILLLLVFFLIHIIYMFLFLILLLLCLEKSL